MDKVIKGDLVKLFRRKRPGLGIVVHCIPDVMSQIPHQDEIQQLLTMHTVPKTWQERALARQTFIENSGLDRAIAEAFIQYNAFNGPTSPAKSKKEFVYIRWAQRPSEYEQWRIQAPGAWYPREWCKKVR